MNAVIKVLGCRAGSPLRDDPCSGYLLKLPQGNVLIDCGAGIATRIVQEEYDKLLAVIITHRHADHCQDLMAFAYRQTFPCQKEKIPLFCPKSVIKVLDEYDHLFGISTLPSMSTPIRNGFSITEVDVGKPFAVPGVGIFDTFRMLHPVETMAIRSRNYSLAFTADGAYTEKLVKFCMGCELIISEATYLEEGDHDLVKHGHMTSLQAGMLGEKAKAKVLLVSHLSDYRVKDKTMEKVMSIFHGKAFLSKPDFEYIFTNN
jgi:ribonuclease BN (tRNA processing enzyme)